MSEELSSSEQNLEDFKQTQLPIQVHQINQVNHFIQLVNQNQRFPDAKTLNEYDPETRNWVLKRTEVEQDHRHKLMEKLVDYEHATNLLNARETHTNQRHAQRIAGVIVLGLLAAVTFLLFYGKSIEAFYTALGLIIPLVIGIAAKIIALFNKKDVRSEAVEPP